MVVGGKEGLGPQELFVRAVLQHRPGNGHAVKSGRAPADLVENQQRVLGRVAQDVRHLRHLHHEGGLSGGEVVAGADAGEDPVHHTDAGIGRRDKGPDLRHEHDQRDLAHIGGLTRHVGAGNDGHPLLLFAHKRVVGHEERIPEHPLHHRMAALPDLNDAGFVHLRPAVAVVHCHRRQRCQGIRLRQGRGGALNPLGRGADLLPQRGEQFIFQSHHPLRGGEDLLLQILKFLGDVPLGVDQGLLADVGLRHLVLERIGYFDVIAEDFVVADLQRADAGALLLPGLHLHNDALAAFEDMAQPVHLRVEAVPDEAAFPHGKGRIVTDGCTNPGPHILQKVQLGRQLGELAVRKGRQLGMDLGQPLNGRPQRGQIPAAGGAVDDAADEPLHVAQTGKGRDQLLPGDGIVHQCRHGAAAPGNGGHAQKRPLQPAPQAPAAHGGAGLVQHPQQGALFLLAPQSCRQLQVPPGRQVQLHEPALLIVIQGIDVGKVRLLGLIEIIQKAAQSHGRRGIPRRQTLECLLAELGADVRLRLRQGKAGHTALFHPAGKFIRQGLGKAPFLRRAGAEHRLRRGKAPQLIDHMLHPVRPGKAGQVGLAGGQVAKRRACRILIQIDAAQIIAGLILQAGRVDHGARRHHPDDVPFDQALGLGRILHLLADGHLVSLGHQPGNVGVAGVIGHAAHGHLVLRGLVGVLVPAGQGQVQLFGGQAGIVGEHLVEVPQPEKQDGVRIVPLDLQILLHHGGQFRHGFTSLSFSYGVALPPSTAISVPPWRGRSRSPSTPESRWKA